MTEANPIQMTAKMLDIRDTVKALYTSQPAAFQAKMGEYQFVLRTLAERWQVDELKALLRLTKQLKAERPGDGATPLFLIAAYVEAVEGHQYERVR